MGSLKISKSSLILLIMTISSMSLLVEPKTFWGDVEAIKELKDALDSNSVSPGSCISSWDFSVDPCDNLFSTKFTCGFRCDLTLAGTSRLTELSLDQVGYSGSLTSLSFNLPYLQTLDLSNNNFYGQLPASLGNLTQLSRLALSSNSFSGELPTSISSIKNLQELYLDNNNIQGQIPAGFNNLTNLKRLELQLNELTGQLPELNSIKSLELLDISNNPLNSQIPTSLPISLIQISMRNSSLHGNIPYSLTGLNYLQVLDLSHNYVTGQIPLFLFTHPSLQQLTLSFNSLNSVQSPPGGFFTNFNTIQSELIAVDLSNNEIRGFLPGFMSLLPKLSALSVENNKLTGMIPTQYAIKAAVPGAGVEKFERLLLGGNYLFGPIPRPLLGLKPGEVNVSLSDNCLYRCPSVFFFCQGGVQKSLSKCKSFSPVIP